MTLDWEKYTETARKVVAEGCVLLKNDEIKDMDELKEMVEYIYKTRIRPEHALTEEIYLFDFQEQTLSKVDEVQGQDMGMTQQM